MFNSLRAGVALFLGTLFTLWYTAMSYLRPRANPPMMRRWVETMRWVAKWILGIKEDYGVLPKIKKNTPGIIFGGHPCTMGSWHLLVLLYAEVSDRLVFVMKDDFIWPVSAALERVDWAIVIPRDDGARSVEIINQHLKANGGNNVYVVFPDGRRCTPDRAKDQVAYLSAKYPDNDYGWIQHMLNWRYRGLYYPFMAFHRSGTDFQLIQVLSAFNRPLLGTTGFFQGIGVVRHHVGATWHARIKKFNPNHVSRNEELFRAWLNRLCKDGNSTLGQMRTGD